jgi:phosphate/sulfate permease
MTPTTISKCRALFGIGIANGQARWTMIRTVLLASLLTLPLSALLSAGFFFIFRQL